MAAARHVVDDGVVAHRVLGRDLALAERRVRELPVPAQSLDRVDVGTVVRRCSSAAIPSAGRARPDLLEPKPSTSGPRPTATASDPRRRSRRRQIHAQPVKRLLHLRALLLEVERDPRRPNCFASSFAASSSSAGISFGNISMIVTSGRSG
jgi:hypothetical protein